MPTDRLPRDSVIAYIPLSVTADLGVAMRRVRAKRISRIKQLCPLLVPSLEGNAVDDGGENKKEGKDASDHNSDVDNDSENEAMSQNDGDDDEHLRDMTSTGVRREQFGSIVEYLEAKYARGVMIDDLDERIRERKKKKCKEGGTGGTNDDDDMSVLSDSAAGSCYSNESGNFINDSALRNEVAHQILGSSAYGKTKIEAKHNDDSSMVGDDDHGFFVNIGDLEMEEGWTEHDLDDDEDWMKMMAKAKGKKRKRTTKDNTAKETEKTKKKVKKNASSNPEKSKKKNVSLKNSSTDSKKSHTDKEKKKESKSKNTSKESNSKASKSKNTSKESNSKTSKKSVAAAMAEGDKVTNNSSGKVSNDKKKKSEKKIMTKKESAEVDAKKAKADATKKETTNLKRRVNRLYKKCVEEITKMTEEHLPRQAKKSAKSKVSIIVPEGKKAGEKISFKNPHDPTQRLQVLIPDNCESGETFKVSVPMPTVTKSSSNNENKFSKECINALDEYSLIYDEWCQAEAKHRDLLPKKKGAEFKVGTERLKKYDQMLGEFPKNLEIPVDAPFLRKVVRRKRQNENKRLKLLEESVKKSETVKTEKKKKREAVFLTLNVPQRGDTFPETEFNIQDFGKTT